MKWVEEFVADYEKSKKAMDKLKNSDTKIKNNVEDNLMQAVITVNMF
jgi:hypothetical protein